MEEKKKRRKPRHRGSKKINDLKKNEVNHPFSIIELECFYLFTMFRTPFYHQGLAPLW
jgi:hypothetical protein